MHRTLVVVAALATGCAHGIPKDLRVESIAPVSATPQQLPRRMRVVTFNTHMETAEHLVAGIKKDPMLRDVDVIALQEVVRDDTAPVPCSSACGIGMALGYYAIYAPGHLAGRHSHGVAILSRAPILSSQVIELPYMDVHINARRCVALVATIDVAGTPVTFYSVHLDNRLDMKQRRVQLRPVLEHARARKTPVIIAGDFNTGPFQWEAHLFPLPAGGAQAGSLEKLVRAYGFDTPVRGSGPTHELFGMKLDGLYTRGIVTKGFAVGRAGYVSDHWPLWAVMELSSNAFAKAVLELPKLREPVQRLMR
ncbi:MAG: endonuclease/exonuclease/phosphatase family protein [Deltaproteobacteria bacterium]|nr:endonuclease/exonuclease/phosphatase family protein [Deltaproteobacteria bacterium]MCW5804946.1 endonuclease/exonuclease/phosphatase family protein [Deltaproteobacteria bacterium]